jgi:hypothetical protein
MLLWAAPSFQDCHKSVSKKEEERISTDIVALWSEIKSLRLSTTVVVLI